MILKTADIIVTNQSVSKRFLVKNVIRTYFDIEWTDVHFIRTP